MTSMHHDCILAETVDFAHTFTDTTQRYAHARVAAGIAVDVAVAPWRRDGAGETIITYVPNAALTGLELGFGYQR